MKKVLILALIVISSPLIAQDMLPVSAKAGGKVYIDLGIGMANMSGNMTPYTAAGSYTPHNGRTKDFYVYKLSSLKKGPQSSAFKFNSSFNLGWDKEIRGGSAMMGLFAGGGVGQGMFQTTYEADVSPNKNMRFAGTSQLVALTSNVNTLTANNVAQTALRSGVQVPNNGRVSSSTVPFAILVTQGRSIQGVNGVSMGTSAAASITTTVNNPPAPPFASLDIGGGATQPISGTGNVMGTRAPSQINMAGNNFATLNAGIPENITGSGGQMGTINTLESDVNTVAANNVAQTELDTTVANSGLANVTLNSVDSATQTETVCMTFREKGRFNGGFRLGVPTGSCFPHLRVGYTLLFVSSEINRKNADTLVTEKYKVSKAVSSVTVGVGVDWNISKSFIMGGVFDCSFGKKTQFDFSKKKILWAPGQVDNKLAVKFAPTVMTFLVTAKYAFPTSR